MSYVSFDYRCPECGHEESRFVHRDEMDAQKCPNAMCIVMNDPTPTMSRLPAGTRTTFKFADRSAMK